MSRNVLRKISFLITEAYYEKLSPQFNKLREAALTDAPDGTEVVVTSCSHDSTSCSNRDSNNCSSGQDISSGSAAFNSTQQMLIVTDSPRILNLCIRQGLYAIALYHDSNHHEDFSATPYAVEDVLAMTYDSYLKAYQRLAGLPWDILKTERLSLRESTVADVDAFYRIYRDPSITRHMENLFDDRDEERAYIENYIQNIYSFYGFGMWTVVHTASGRIIGRAGLNVREGYELPELGFVTDVSFQKQGYTYEICHAILQYAFEELEFPKVQAFCHPDNTASAHLLQKLGFVYKEEALIDEGPHARYEISAPA